jgi:hypothetical protein
VTRIEIVWFFRVKSCLAVHSDSVYVCTETFFIFQEILRAKSDAGVSLQFDRRPMALRSPGDFAVDGRLLVRVLKPCLINAPWAFWIGW